MRVIIYGAPGVGKTTCASCFPDPILIRTEDGASEIDVPTFPLVRSLSDLGDAIQTLQGEHNFKTLIIDSLDWLEPLVFASVCEGNGKRNISDFSFGSGYQLALSTWKMITQTLDMLRARKGMHIVLIAHADTKKIDPPDGVPYVRYDMKLQTLACNHIMEWSDYMFFLTRQSTVQAADERRGTRGKAISTGERVIHLSGGVAFQGKSRKALPSEITCSLDYHELTELLFK